MEQTIKQRPERADVFTGRTENVDVFSVAMATRTDAKQSNRLVFFNND